MTRNLGCDINLWEYKIDLWYKQRKKKKRRENRSQVPNKGLNYNNVFWQFKELNKQFVGLNCNYFLYVIFPKNISFNASLTLCLHGTTHCMGRKLKRRIR